MSYLLDEMPTIGNGRKLSHSLKKSPELIQGHVKKKKIIHKKVKNLMQILQ